MAPDGTMQAESPDQPWFSKDCVLGIDEAGRGPVLGDMVYACAFCTSQECAELAQMGFADSKKLTEARREELFTGLVQQNMLGWATDSLTAAFISEQMLRVEKVSLNVLAMDSTFRLIDRVLQRGVNLQQVFVDTVGDAGKHQAALSARFPSIRFTVCPKADAIYPIVSAASIVAKVTRDRALVAYQAASGSAAAFGSGYPSDPVTKQWLLDSLDPVFGLPPVTRLSWATCTRLIEEHGGVPVKWACEEQAAQPGSWGQTSLQPAAGAQRHSFFRARQLASVVRF